MCCSKTFFYGMLYFKKPAAEIFFCNYMNHNKQKFTFVSILCFFNILSNFALPCDENIKKVGMF